MLIATWNVNSIKSRLDLVTRWLEEARPDVVCLQEIKCVDEAFPRAEIEALGYNVAVHGQKTYNGVALLSRAPMEVESPGGLPGDESDEQARYIEAAVSAGDGVVRVGGLYLPNGNPAPGPKYDYKLGWMDRLHAHASARLKLEEPFILAGDYNVIPEPRDARRPENWVGDALFLPETHGAWRRLLALGFTDALRATDEGGDIYTFWDYQAGAWQKNNGIRIDHLLLSPQAADRLVAVRVDKHVRSWERPSDHVPVVIELAGVERSAQSRSLFQAAT
ncbi:exodeoxyribonuclease III [Chelatococcus sambhunathii]|uniref:Exodeoxyribonuclease III n=1 Tax=Chelatococcus sambhunathii TaxID=363953 RepID=A0ABU1DKM3_9HYPH|nr:exodeoxyribonuclease III [Chelatococcus sambhunathii]MDR4308435.1 exodeoxyribonuclease III [Chelatococcus sambhunathii]